MLWRRNHEYATQNSSYRATNPAKAYRRPIDGATLPRVLAGDGKFDDDLHHLILRIRRAFIVLAFSSFGHSAQRRLLAALRPPTVHVSRRRPVAGRRFFATRSSGLVDRPQYSFGRRAADAACGFSPCSTWSRRNLRHRPSSFLVPIQNPLSHPL